MIRDFRTIFIALLVMSLGACCLTAQTDNLRLVLANLSEDVGLLNQEVKKMRLELEAVQRENVRLRQQVAALSSDAETDNQISSLSAAIETVRREYRQADAAQKKEIVTEISRQIDTLARETQTALNSVSRSGNSEPTSSPNVTVDFTNDYPKTGKPYVVRSGDSLSKIARDHGSTVKYIQNANKIVDPSRDLRIGDTIFIPIAE